MKRILITVLLALSVCVAMGCGNKAEKTESGTVKVDNNETANTIVVETPTPEPEKEEPTPEPTLEPTPEPEPPTWFEEHGLAITPQGDFTFTTMANNGKPGSGIKDLYEIEIPANVSITETTDGADEGYKKVIAVFNGNSEGRGKEYGTLEWHSAFDRYTGISFEADTSVIWDEGGRSGSIPIEYDGKTYDIGIDFDYTSSNEHYTVTITVTCPEDYDGTIFQCGYVDQEIDKQYDSFDLKSKLYTIDELPYFGSNGHEYYYFSYSNK